MPRPVVDAGGVAEGVEEVRRELDLGASEIRRGRSSGRDPRDQLIGGVSELLMPEAEGWVAIPGVVRERRGGSYEPRERRDDLKERGDGGGRRGGERVGELAAVDGGGERGDEAEEVSAVEGRVESSDVVRGGDLLGGGLEGVGRRGRRHRERLRDRGEDDGGGVSGRVDCWAVSGAVGRRRGVGGRGPGRRRRCQRGRAAGAAERGVLVDGLGGGGGGRGGIG
jgi:hypothetical protein